jgi:hypothetical protein
MGILLGVAVGFLLGLVLHRGDFCMQSALREIVNRRPGSSLRAYLLALAVQLALVNTLGMIGWLEIPFPAVTVAATAVGGLAFGIGMVLGKG